MRPHPPIREIADLRCPYCAQAPVLLRAQEHADAAEGFRWRVAIGCRPCRLAIDDFGPTEQAATDGAVGRWHWLFPEPIDVRDALAIRPGRP